MEKKKIRRLYLAVKSALFTLFVLLILAGCHYIFLDGCEATAAMCWLFSGATMTLFTELTE